MTSVGDERFSRHLNYQPFVEAMKEHEWPRWAHGLGRGYYGPVCHYTRCEDRYFMLDMREEEEESQLCELIVDGHGNSWDPIFVSDGEDHRAQAEALAARLPELLMEMSL